MTEIAASAEQDRNRWRTQIEALAISVCRIKQLPDPDPETLHLLVSKAMGLFALPEVGGAEALSEPVLAFVVASIRRKPGDRCG